MLKMQIAEATGIKISYRLDRPFVAVSYSPNLIKLSNGRHWPTAIRFCGDALDMRDFFIVSFLLSVPGCKCRGKLNYYLCQSPAHKAAARSLPLIPQQRVR